MDTFWVDAMDVTGVRLRYEGRKEWDGLGEGDWGDGMRGIGEMVRDEERDGE